MKVYYPRCRAFLRIVWEDFGKTLADRDKAYLLPDPPVLEAEVVNNDYKQADTFRLILPYDSFPFDPRLIRACGVAIYMGNVDSPEKDIRADGGATDRENLKIIGFVDDATIEIGEDSKVTLEGRDQTALLLDEKWHSFLETKEGKEDVRLPAGIDLRRPLDQVLRYILDKSLATAPMKIELRGVTAPTLGKWHSVGEQEISEEASFWDIIKHLTHVAGLICFVEFDTLVVTSAKTLNDRSTVGAAFVYGENLTSLQLKRKLGRMRASNVRVRSYDDTKKRTLIGSYPKTPIEKVEISAKGDVTKKRQYDDFTVPNVADKAQLDKIAESIYRQRSFQQLDGSLKTEDMTSIVGSAEKPLTKVVAGSAIRVEVDPEDRAQLRNMDATEREQYLKNRGYASQVAAAVARAFDDIDTFFYVKTASHRYSHVDGYSLGSDFVNFIQGDKVK